MADLVLIDGVCVLCQRLTRFLLARDRADRLRFAALQSPIAERALARHAQSPAALDTVCVLVDFGAPSERLLVRARAVLHAVGGLGAAWRAVALLGWLPTRLLDWGYDFIARRRLRWFGRLDACALPSPEHRHRFLDVS